MDASSTFTRTADDVSSGSDVDIEDRPQTVNRSLDAPPAEEVNQKLSITVGEKVPSSEEEVVVDDVDDETPTPTSRGRRKMSCVLLLLLFRLHSLSCATQVLHASSLLLLSSILPTLTQPPQLPAICSIRQAKKQLSSRRLSTLIATTEADDVMIHPC